MKKTILGIFLFVIAAPMYAAPTETLPTHHWVYPIISELQARGHLLELSQLNLPYTRRDVATALLDQDELTGMNGQWLDMLKAEFDQEIKVLIEPVNHQQTADIYFKGIGNLDHNEEANLEFKGIYRGGVGLNLNRNLYAFTAVNFNQYDVDDPGYVGYEWRGITGYTEQAYLSYKADRFYIKAGRDYIKWGAGRRGKLVMSDVTRPLDQVYAAAKLGPFTLSYFASQLDDLGRYRLDAKSSMPIRRFLSGHRLDVTLLDGRLQAAVTELMLYGGAGETFNPAYVNPLIFWHGANYNNKTSIGNVLPTVDFMYYPTLNSSVYLSLLIDDIQVEKTGPTDLEPNEIGLIVGGHYADPFHLQGLELFAEYTRIANRTYKTPTRIEYFLHRDEPLGHPLGNDFERILLGASWWPRKDLQSRLDLSYTRHGEGSIYTDWDAPWMAFTVDEGYSEPFPTGTVEKTVGIVLEIRYYYRHWCRFDMYLESRTITNMANVSGVDESEFMGALRIDIDADYILLF